MIRYVEAVRDMIDALTMQEDVVVDRRRLGRYRVADFLPPGVALGYLARTEHGTRVVAPYDPGQGGADRVSGHLVDQVWLDSPERYLPAVIRWGW